MIVHIENPTGSTKKLLDLESDFDKGVGYESMAFLYTNHEISETEIKRRNLTYYSNNNNNNKIKYLGRNLTKEVKDLYSENYRTLKKETEEHTNKWKHVPGSWNGRINIIKMFTLTKAIYRFNAILFKYQWHTSQV